MAVDDRDRRFEKALALRLRASAQGAECPDAETLATYHERSLTPDELNSWKTHISSCANCQQILAHLESLDEIPLGALAGVEGSGEAPDLIEAGAVAAVAHDASGAPAAAPKKADVVSVTQFPRRLLVTHWRWTVPAGAIAAGLLVWLAVHENQPAAFLPPAKTEIAQNRPPTEESKLGAPAPAKPEAFDKSAALSKAVPPGGDRGSVSSALQNRRDLAEAKSPSPKISAPAPLAGREATPAESQGAPLPANSQVSLDARKSGVAPGIVGGVAGGGAGGAMGSVETRQKDKKLDEHIQEDQATNYVAGLPPAAPKPQSAAQADVPDEKDAKQLPAVPAATETVNVTSAMSAAPPSAPPTPSGELKEPSQEVKALPNASRSTTDLLTVTSGAEAAPALRVAKSRAPRTVAAPGGKVIWRLGLGGLIERSLDGGQTWTPQTSGTTENLFLGSAPSEQVCWVISISGTILRTSDGGATWLSVVSPIPQNLGLIRASDALHATVWDMSRRLIFQTSDGGAAWTPTNAPARLR